MPCSYMHAASWSLIWCVGSPGARLLLADLVRHPHGNALHHVQVVPCVISQLIVILASLLQQTGRGLATYCKPGPINPSPYLPQGALRLTEGHSAMLLILIIFQEVEERLTTPGEHRHPNHSFSTPG
jgi:hypothetical protein